MDIKLPKLPPFIRRTQRDGGISLRRANHHWFLALMSSAVVTLLVGGVAYYEFTMVQKEDIILTDPVQTARYRADAVKAALEYYDARREAYVIGAPDPRLNMSAESESDDTVAPASTLKVE